MPNIETRAAIINEETWPIAVACLAGGFATIPFERIEGHILVLNEVEARLVKGGGDRPVVCYGNSHMPRHLFEELYRFDEMDLETNLFTPVVLK